MLEQVLTYIHNWFPVEAIVKVWQIEGGTIELPHLQEGQYFRIVGSVFNDGLHQYPAADLKDETFRGGIWSLAVPPAVVKLAQEIQEWEETNGEAASGPFASESFGGYSYTLNGETASGGSDDPASGWQRVFRSRLIPYRKLS